MSQKNKRPRLTWEDAKQIVEFKTFYFVILLSLLGIVLILLDSLIFSANVASPWKGVLAALGVTLLTSSTVSMIYEISLRLDVTDLMVEKVLKALPSEIGGTSGLIRFGNDRTSLDFHEVWQDSSGFLKIIGFSANDILSPANTPLLINKLKENPSFNIQILIFFNS